MSLSTAVRYIHNLCKSNAHSGVADLCGGSTVLWLIVSSFLSGYYVQQSRCDADTLPLEYYVIMVISPCVARICVFPSYDVSEP